MDERIPLTVASAAPSARSQRLKTAVKYAAGAAALFALGAVLFTQHSSTQAEQGASLRTSSSASASFPGAADEILDLFGKPKEYTSRIFSGYLPLDNGGEAFYFLADSQSETADKDPVLLWLNGGPGASSLSGCFSENGPLLVNDDGQSLRVNDYAWNKNANLLCIESPIGVGFSYNNSGVYVSDDLSQADDLYNALQQFYVKYPQLRENDFIISGESYGGIYVPTTARAIVEGNAKGDAPVINLKKFVVGNGVNEFSALSQLLFAYYHGIISTEDYQLVRRSCPSLKEFEKSPSFFSGGLDLKSECGRVSLKVMVQLFTSHINSYNVAGKCEGPPDDGMTDMVKKLMQAPKGFPHPIGGGGGMCLDESSMETYFNTAKVREAFHTKPDIDRWSGSAMITQMLELVDLIPGAEGLVNITIDKTRLLDYTSSLQSEVTPIWKFLLAHNVSGVIYHGDADIVCDFIGGLWAVESLKLPRKAARAPWFVDLDGTQQVGGFLEDFEGLTYVTVKGAGHLVPMWKPVEAKKMLDLFVLN